VEIDGQHYVDGALKKTLNASVALEEGAKLVFCVNPLVPFDANDARRKQTGKGRQRVEKLVEGGLPTVLSQTFRAIIHSRMHVGLQKYVTAYKDRDVVLFEPAKDDSEIFFTNLFSYATRKRVCEHAYQRTRADLLKRRFELEPVLAKYGIALNLDVLRDEKRTLDHSLFKRTRKPPKDERLLGATVDLTDAIAELERFIGRNKADANLRTRTRRRMRNVSESA
jgi:NTE family protein